MLRLLVGCALSIVAACGGKKGNAIAELTKADGPVERQQGTGAWTPAKLGTLYYIGDAARTADGPAQLQIAGGGALIAMQPHTVLRFGGKEGNSKIAVELGAIDLTGSGLVGLDVGDVRLAKGTVRITAKGSGAAGIELQMGEAQVSNLQGQTIDLVIGSVVDLNMDDVTVTTVVDAGVPDAPVDAVVDVPPAADEAQIVVTGKKAEILNPGEKKWTPLPAGAGVLARGSRVRLGKGATAKVTAKGTTLDMAGGASMSLGADLQLMLDGGDARGSVDAQAQGKVSLPGGAIELRGGQTTGAEAKLDVRARDTKVAIGRGLAKLVGANGGQLDMNRGESATLAKNGTIRVIEAIPSYFDFRAVAGESFTVYDPKGNTAVQFSFDGKCKDGGFIEMDENARFQTAKVSGGKDQANIMVGAGSWAYRLRCDSGSGAAVASGRVIVKKDGGNRPLPKQAATNQIDADGRTWRISYQSVIPTVQVSTKGVGSSFKLHIATGGKEQVFEGKGAKISVPGSKLDEGTYTYWLERDGERDPKVSTLIIDFDNTAPQVYIQNPINGRPWEGEILVRGAVLPNWTAAVEGVQIPIDRQRRFSAKVGKPPGNALAIRLSNPQFGVRYYLRRQK